MTQQQPPEEQPKQPEQQSPDQPEKKARRSLLDILMNEELPPGTTLRITRRDTGEVISSTPLRRRTKDEDQKTCS